MPDGIDGLDERTIAHGERIGKTEDKVDKLEDDLNVLTVSVTKLAGSTKTLGRVVWAVLIAVLISIVTNLPYVENFLQS